MLTDEDHRLQSKLVACAHSNTESNIVIIILTLILIMIDISFVIFIKFASAVLTSQISTNTPESMSSFVFCTHSSVSVIVCLLFVISFALKAGKPQQKLSDAVAP